MTIRDEIGRENDQKYALSFPIIFFLLGNDTLENDTDNKKSIHRK
jgi:hypothetical protein